MQFKETNTELFLAARECLNKARFYYGQRTCGYGDYAGELEDLADSMIEELEARFAHWSDPHPDPKVVITRKIMKINVAHERMMLYNGIDMLKTQRRELREYVKQITF